MHWLQVLGMHNKSQHHFITHNMVDSVKKDEEREKLAEQHKRSQTIIHKIAWKSLLGIIIGEGRMRLA